MMWWAWLMLGVVLMVGGCAKRPVVIFPASVPPIVARPPAPPAPVAPPEDLVVVVPKPDGQVGKLTIDAHGVELTLAHPFAAARLRPDDWDLAYLTEFEHYTIFKAALVAAPPRPTTFLVFFTFGTDQLTAESARTFEQIRADILGRPVPELILIGHTDRAGRPDYNLALSLKRAAHVKRALVGKGIRAEHIQTQGRGERDATGKDAHDRRVEIVVR